MALAIVKSSCPVLQTARDVFPAPTQFKASRRPSAIANNSLPSLNVVRPGSSTRNSAVLRPHNASFLLHRRVQENARRAIICQTAADAAAPAPQQASVAGISNTDAVVNIFKSIMGAGCFALPYAFANGGTVLASVCLIASALLSMYTTKLTQDAKELLLQANKGTTGLNSYTSIAYATVGTWGGILSEAMTVLTCLGICSAYLVFVASTLQTVLVPPLYPKGPLTHTALVKVVTPLMIGLSWFRSIAGVSVISKVGTASVALGMAFVAWYALQQPLSLAVLPVWEPSQFSKFFGSVAFLFFTHFGLPSIEASMADRSQFVRSAVIAYSLSGAVCLVFAILGAAAFGPNVSSVVITMLEGNAIATVVKLLLCVNLLATFPIVVRAAFLVVEGWLQKASGGTPMATLPMLAMRTAFVVVAAVAATCIPSFGSIIGLVSGVSLSIISLVLPSLMLMNAERIANKGDGLALTPGNMPRLLTTLLGTCIVAYTLVTGA